MNTHVVRPGPATRLAAKELARYLTRMTDNTPNLRVGTFEALGLPPAQGGAFDDEILIETTARSGVIAGANDRSVLLAVYRYLTELGCRWVRPGRSGEILPTRRGLLPAVKLREKPSYRHRGVCIEGAVNWEHVRDLVDWLPKLGFNAYFIQFRDSYNFFQRWYEHEYNPRWSAEEMTAAKAHALTTRLRAEIKKRGMVLHLVGHGWTCEPFGIPGPGWHPHQGPIPPESVQYLAEVNGQRQLHDGIALNTNLCYGNPETRRIVTEAIVAYARENPDVDVIHFWLADGVNNHCECPLCRDIRPSDLYVRMLNELDEKLTAAQVATKVVFLAYVDLLWPPQKERIKNPARFLLMFAPITRSYSTSFTAVGRAQGRVAHGTRSANSGKATLPPFRRNKLKFPANPATNLAFLRAWKAQFPGDKFDFDYHLWWDHYKDPAEFAVARVLSEDVRGLHDIGLNGYMSCQVQRAFFPTGLGMTVLGRTLWDRKRKMSTIVEDHLRACFGEGSQEVGKFLKRISKLFSAKVLRHEGAPAEVWTAVRNWRRIPATVSKAKAMMAAGKAKATGNQVRSWEILERFGEMATLMSVALAKKYEGAEDAKAAAWVTVEWARQAERDLHPVFDAFEFLTVIGRCLGLTHKELKG